MACIFSILLVSLSTGNLNCNVKFLSLENDSIRIGLFITLAAILILFTSIFGCVGGITSERPYLGVVIVIFVVL